MSAATSIVLKTRYYLDHFEEMITFVESHYEHVIEADHRELLVDFRRLSQDAQCLYVRLANRKGTVFPVSKIRYDEIRSLNDSICELKSCGFARSIRESDYPEILDSRTRPEMVELIRQCAPGPQSAHLKLSSARKDQLKAFVLECIPFRDGVPASCDKDFIVQGRVDPLEFILFLYFGSNEANLTSFALRDLGVVKRPQLKSSFEARFSSADEAKASFFYNRLLPTIKTASPDDLKALSSRYQKWPVFDSIDLEAKRHRALHKLGLGLERSGDATAALEIYEASGQFPSTERRARLLYNLGRKTEAKSLLTELIQDPSSDGELIFAEDFYERKFQKRKVGRLTELLRNSPVLEVDESFRDRPEQACVHHYGRRGIAAFHVENVLWQQLFGIFLWDLIFDPDNAALHNAFELRPSDLENGIFLRRRKDAIRTRLDLMQDREAALQQLEKNWTRHKDTPNGITAWYPEVYELVRELVFRAKPGSLAHILEAMLKDYRHCRSGFPDLLLLDGDSVRFVEVKAQGDQIRRNQLLQLERLQSVGIPVEIARVEWVVDPEQEYVVVDIETTGGNAKWNRVTEIGAVKIKGGQVLDEWQTLINPGRSIPRRIVELTGITDEMVSNAPPFSEIAEELSAFLGDAVFVAHNAKFDYGFLREEFARLEQPFHYPTLCTVVAARRYFPGLKSYRLSKLCAHFEIPLNTHHRALCDARATASLLMKINEKRMLEK